MSRVIQLTAFDGAKIEFIDEIKASGAMKDVYFSPQREYVVAFFRRKADAALIERLQAITGSYRQRVFQQQGADYWTTVYCWPTTLVSYQDRIGVVVPFYAPHFFFAYGAKQQDMLGIKGKEKEGKWFASASNRQKFLDERELGTWLHHVRIGLQIARAVRRLHAAGLAHSDLSYKNVLVDPITGNACLIDLDGLVVPDKFAPDVVGTPDFIAPECVKTAHLAVTDPARVLPSISTDEHALAVLIYMYLLYRHPLRGDKVHDVRNTQRDDALMMGEAALFIEHPEDTSNRINKAYVNAAELPWKDTQKLPYTVTGMYLSPLFFRAFVTGLHQPQLRPSADEWEQALIKTVDVMLPCGNSACQQKWYVLTQTPAICPFCHTPWQGSLPLLNFYSAAEAGRFVPDNHRLTVYHHQSLYPWHSHHHIVPNERLSPAQKKRVGYFVFHQQQWLLVNEALPDLVNVSSKQPIAIGDNVTLVDGLQLLLSKGEGSRLVVVQMV
ncbi:helix-hairpin-helix domain-containing protein [Agitococcus lubricus]|uniref:Protein kinase-like protein n=1 Tax=Agitococcus lubricus TaxID=1077255 RepID=A0A2T5J2X6_9GAMM|nr:lipopolysaccharide kinase InaA family protein [Agitococcus lubricus]PTQ90752.1 protein kinase-like protein [Agitococcus lubricus]